MTSAARYLGRIAALSAFASAGCMQQPVHHALPAPVNVPASFDRTWAAVIDIFSAGSIPIRTMEKASGLIVAEPLAIGLEMSRRYADCGAGAFGPNVANRASYNVRVTGDSTASLVRVTANFSSTVLGQCTSLGEFERFMMASIVARATGR